MLNSCWLPPPIWILRAGVNRTVACRLNSAQESLLVHHELRLLGLGLFGIFGLFVLHFLSVLNTNSKLKITKKMMMTVKITMIKRIKTKEGDEREELYGPQSLTYLLSDPLQKEIAEPCSNLSSHGWAVGGQRRKITVGIPFILLHNHWHET